MAKTTMADLERQAYLKYPKTEFDPTRTNRRGFYYVPDPKGVNGKRMVRCKKSTRPLNDDEIRERDEEARKDSDDREAYEQWDQKHDRGSGGINFG